MKQIKYREQLAQRGCGVFILRNIKKPTDPSDEQLILAEPALSKGAGPDNLQRFPQTSIILRDNTHAHI